MEKHTQYFIVDGNMLPEIYLKVAQAKELLERGEVRTIHQAVCQIGISRSAFYKYKDAIRPFQDMTQGRIINFQIRLKNEPGVLSLICEMGRQYSDDQSKYPGRQNRNRSYWCGNLSLGNHFGGVAYPA